MFIDKWICKMLNILVGCAGSRAFTALFTLAVVVHSLSTDMGRKRKSNVCCNEFSACV